MGIDEAKSAFDTLYPKWLANKAAIETEQDARFQVIDRMLTKVLGWEHIDVKTEPHVESGYIDYLLRSDNRNRFVVEAKKAAKILIDTTNPRVNSYKVGGPALQSAQTGLEQAKRYCLDTAVPFAALTTGFEWIAFWALRTDGVSPMDSKAIVFPDLEAIRENFAMFYDLFSKEGIVSNFYQIHIHQAEGLQIQHAETLSQALVSSDVRLFQKSKLAADLENVFKRFFSTMSGENDPEMLARCFVQSKESREADISLQKITRNLINRIDIVDSAEGDELQEHIRVAVESQHGEFVLIIGNKGAGKSTFIDRFFRLILERDLKDRCLLIRIDLADSDGNMETIVSWLVDRMKEEVEEVLFGGRNPTYEELQGIFYSEYERWRTGEHKYLYERDKGEFKEKFGAYVADLVANSADKYIGRLVRDAIKSRKLMPCLIFDNTDHFPQSFQERVFQFAQSIHRTNFSFVICPITDRTIWQLSKQGPFQSYETTAFYLPVPSTKEVLEKRVSFLKDKLTAEGEKGGSQYFLARGIRLTVKDLSAFAACIDEIFVQSEYVSRTIGWLSNHDIRRSLNIARRVITSPIISMEDLIKAYVSGSNLTISRLKIRQALIFNDYSQFNQEANDYILNLFIVARDQVTSPLIKLSIIRLLMDREAQSSNVENTYMTVEDIQNYLEPCGLGRLVVRTHLKNLLDYRLVEPYDPTDQGVYETQRLRVTHCGQIHYEFALRDDVYVTSMALTTGVRSGDLVAELRDIKSRKMGKGDWLEISKIFIKYILREDEAFVSIPTMDMYKGQAQMRNELRNCWQVGQ